MSGSIFDRDRLTQRPQLDMSSITQMATRGGRAGRSAAATIIGGAQAQNQFNQTENALALGQDALGLRRDELAQQQTQFDTTGERLDDQMAQGAITGLRGGLSQPVASSVGSALGTPATGVSSSALGQPNTTPRPIFGSSSPAGMDYDPLSRRPGMQNGGRIGNPRRDNGQDTVPVMARQGEYYLNPETVQHLGGGDYSKGLRGLNSLVREATGKEPGPTPPDKNGLRGYADSGVVRKGGKIKGPGTGTSDSIKTKVPGGTYIMPADSTEQIGEKTLGELGKPVPVNLSNGEYQMPPEQVHAVGAQVLDQMKVATHTPVATTGFKPQGGDLYFADGGLIGGAAQYWANDNAQFEAGNPSFGSRVVRTLNPATAFGSAMGAMHTAAGNGDKTGMALAAAQAIPVFGAARSVVRPAMGAIKAARAIAPSAAKTGVAIAGSGAAGAMADTYGAPEKEAAPQQTGAAFSDMRRALNIPRSGAPRRGFADGGLVRKGMYTDANQELVDGALTTGRAIQQVAFPQTAAAFGRVGDDTNAAYQNRGAGAAIGTAVNRAVKVPVGVAKDVGASTMRVVTPAVEFAGDLSGALMGDNTPVATQPARPTKVPGQVSPQAPKQGARALPQRSPEEEFRARHTGADQYRDAWQGRTKGGLRNADSDAVRLYNAEQQARGTGVRAQRQANGTMSFGDYGVTAPQYLSANGAPTNDWKDTSQYRDAVMRNLGSSDKGLRQRGLAMAKDLELRDKPYDPEAQFKTAEALQRLELGQQNLAQGAQQLSAGKANALNSAFDRLGVPPDLRAIVMQNIGPGLSEMSPNESEAAVAKTLMDLEALGVANAASIGGVTSNRMPTNIGLRRPNWGEVRFGGPDDENPNAFGVIDYLTGGDKQVAEDGVIDSSGNRQVLRAINVARAREASKKNLDTLTRLGIK